MADFVKPHLDLGRVGHDNGRLVLRLERRLALSSAQVRTALSSQFPTGGEDVERWEVDDEHPGSRLALTAWIDAEDVESAASAGAEYHGRFERLVRDVEEGTVQHRSDVHVPALVEGYGGAFAAALADTD